MSGPRLMVKNTFLTIVDPEDDHADCAHPIKSKRSRSVSDASDTSSIVSAPVPSSTASARSTLDSNTSAQALWDEANNFQQMHARLQHLSEFEQRRQSNVQDSTRPPSLLATARQSLSSGSSVRKTSKEKVKAEKEKELQPREKDREVPSIAAAVGIAMDKSRKHKQSRGGHVEAQRLPDVSTVSAVLHGATLTASMSRDQGYPSSAGHVDPGPAELEPVPAEDESSHDGPRTTVMLRNLPNEYSRCMLLELLDSEGFFGHYDFVYLPIDFTSRTNFGYAFINLVASAQAERFKSFFQGFNRWSTPCDKVADVTWSSTHQGLAEHINRYRNSPIMHDTMPDECKPVIFSNGVRTSFPPATKTTKPPRVRPSKSRSLRGVLQEDRVCIFGVEESAESASFMDKVRKNLAASEEK
eukprot:gnl/TRDRNA2_/TRDRNA2_83289_c0_seq2.p1 gnl/TRDRNA2_/TRDRNA2_83289_c0~~gnl/TRDRNA2_/TRDRNA2_83289_c0_seq2.p1  ORF type:complete len:413 (+),score=71.15 gnl/TRDRNA2_/TRDRNA2_83289_c0_seq2:102-1340(+)